MTALSNFWRDVERNDPIVVGLRPMLRQIDELFNEMLAPGTTTARPELGRGFTPALEVEDATDHYLLSFDVPGVAVEDLNIEVLSGNLIVTGERKPTRLGNGHQAGERRYGKFQRVLSLPEGVKADNIESHYKDGVLKILIPKATESKATKIKIGEGKSGFLKNLLGDKKGKEAAESKPEHVSIAN